MAIQHTVVFRLAHEAGSPSETEFLDTARSTLTAIEGVTDFTVNRQVSPKSDLTWQFSMVFADQSAYDAYNTHPDHVGFVEGRWEPEVAAFQEYDFVVESTAPQMRAPFEMVERTEDTYDDGEAPALTHVTIQKRYDGAITGTGVAHVLLAQGAEGSGYVASERVVGEVDGRSGSFVVQHVGVADGSELSATGRIVPHSGTGDLADLRGRAYEAEMGVLTLELE